MPYEIGLTVDENLKKRVKFVDQAATLVHPVNVYEYRGALERIETMGRLCYGSESKGDPDTFIRNIIKRQHLSVLEHASMSVIINCSRATSHQLVRHRIASFSQASQRYINHAKTDDTEIYFCNPVPALPAGLDAVYRGICIQSFNAYAEMIYHGVEPDRARMCLTNGALTTIGITADLREWRHIFQIRLDSHASKAMRYLMRDLYCLAVDVLPCIFDDIELPADLLTAGPEE